MKTIIQYLESRIQPTNTHKKVSRDELFDIVENLSEKAFGRNALNIHNFGLYGGGFIDINIGDRHFRLSVDDVRIASPVKELPEVYISFDWTTHPDDKGVPISLKDGEVGGGGKAYKVRQQMEQDTMKAVHKIRDLIIRPLSKYECTIFYYAIGERRERFYASMLKSSGFKPINIGLNPTWIPSNFTIPTPKPIQAARDASVPQYAQLGATGDMT